MSFTPYCCRGVTGFGPVFSHLIGFLSCSRFCTISSGPWEAFLCHHWVTNLSSSHNTERSSLTLVFLKGVGKTLHFDRGVLSVLIWEQKQALN